MNSIKLISFLFSIYPVFCFSQKENIIYSSETNSPIFDICLTPRAKVLGVTDGKLITFLATDKPQIIKQISNESPARILCMDISGDSTILVTGDAAGQVNIWDLKNCALIKILATGQKYISSVKISQENNYVVAGGSDCKVQVYNLEAYNLIKDICDHTKELTTIALSGNGNMFVTGAADGLVNLYDATTLELINSWKAHKSWIRDLSFNSDGTVLLSCGDDLRIIKWIIDGKTINKRSIQRKIGWGWIMSSDIFKDGTTYAYGTYGGYVVISGESGNYKEKIGNPVLKILFITDNTDNLTLAVATLGKGLVMLNARSMKYKDISED